MRARVAGAVLAGMLACSGAAWGQDAADHFDRGSRAYQALELGEAVRELRHALAVTTADSLPAFARANALMYLFAAERLWERPDSADAAARRLLALEPRYRPDALVFPPPILDAFDDVRRATPLVAVRASSTFDFASDAGMPVTLVASTPHHVVVLVTQVGGAPVAEVYAGRIEDSLDLRWDGADSLGTPVPAGRQVLRVTSRDARGRVAFERRLTLDILGARPVSAAVRSRTAPAAGRGPELGVGLVMVSITSRSATGTERRSGAGLAAAAGHGVGPVALRIAYAEAELSAPGGGRVLADARLQAGIHVRPWLSLWVGPHLRAVVREPERERWVLWEARVMADAPLAGDRVRGFVGTWGIAAGHSEPAGTVAGWGAEGGLAVRLVGSRVWARLSYRRDQASLASGAREENAEFITALVQANLGRTRRP